MTSSLIRDMRATAVFMRSTAATVLIAFTLMILEPAVAAAQTAGDGTTSTTTATDTAEDQLSKTLQHIEDKLARLEDKLAQQLDGTLERNDLKQLQQTLQQLDQTVRQGFQQVEQHITDQGLAAVIMDRHQAMVTHYQDEYQALIDELNAIDTAADDSERKVHAQNALNRLKTQKNKRSQQPFDPNDLPWSNPDASKTREPSDTVAQLTDAIGIYENNQPIVLATNIITPEMLNQPGGPTIDDLSETPDIRLTDSIRNKAHALEDDPVKIYNWVKDNIEFIPTYGSIQGAERTLAIGKGNAFDTASLLIALYRAANIPARYAYGTVQIPSQQVMNWVGNVDVPQAAQQILGQGGIPNIALASGGTITHIKLEHIWVEAWLDYFPSRASKHYKGDSWIPLDPSFKQYSYNNPTLDISGLTYENKSSLESLGPNNIWNQQSQTSEITVAIDSLLNNLNNLLDSNNTKDELDDLFGKKKIILKDSKVIASSLPYKIVARTNNFSQIPDNLRHKIKYTLSDLSGNSAPLLYETSLPELSGKDLSVRFLPETDSDMAALTALIPDSETATINDLPQSISSYLIRLSAQINVDGNETIKSGSYTLGADVRHEISLFSPSQGWQSRQVIGAAGEYRAIGIDQQGLDESDLEEIQGGLQGIVYDIDHGSLIPESNIVEKLLQLGIKQYYGTIDLVNEYNSSYNGVVQYRLPSFGYFQTTLNTSYFFGIPRTVSFSGVTMDIPRLNSISVAKDNNQSTWINYNKKSGLIASYLENAIPEEIFYNDVSPPKGVSAVKALDYALSQGQQVYIINDSNSSLIYNISIDDDARQQIINAVYAGKEITVHEAPVQIGDWSGSGYIISDNQTGAGAYLISGGTNGGYLGIELDTWLGILSLGIDFIPGVGSVKAIIELITGKDLITGQPINRFLVGIAVVAGFVGGAAAVKGLISTAEKLVTANVAIAKLGKLGESAVNIAKGFADGVGYSRSLTRFTINGRARYADGVKFTDETKTVFKEMWEVKNKNALSDSDVKQIQDYLEYIEVQRMAGRNIDFDLYVRGPGFETPTDISKASDLFSKYNVIPKYLEDLGTYGGNL